MRETAAAHLVTRVPTARAHEPAGAVRQRLLGQAWDVLGELYLVDDAQRLVAVVDGRALLAAPAAQPVGELGRVRVAVRPGDDQEAVAQGALRAGVTAVPVVDDAGALLGVVPPLALVDILHREHVEDLHRLAGIGRERQFARDALEQPPSRRARDRLPWLLVGLAGSAVATWVMTRYEHTLQQRVAVSFFVPAIVYLADAVGTQTEACVVRGLSLTQMSLRDLLRGEASAGVLLGLMLGGVSLPLVWLAFGDVRLAFAVAIAVLVAAAVATTVGLLLPWALHRFGRDPAFGSGPLATVVQDVLSLVVYLATVEAVMA